MIRIGFGYDVHKIEPSNNPNKKEIVICNLCIPTGYTVQAHSDGDVAIHALVDAILGAACIQGSEDIGTIFPPTDPTWKNKNSRHFLEHTRTLIEEHLYTISNVDITLVCETPKISKYRDQMKQNIAEILRINLDQISIKGKTNEKLGFIGEKRGIACYATVLLLKKETKLI